MTSKKDPTDSQAPKLELLFDVVKGITNDTVTPTILLGNRLPFTSALLVAAHEMDAMGGPWSVAPYIVSDEGQHYYNCAAGQPIPDQCPYIFIQRIPHFYTVS